MDDYRISARSTTVGREVPIRRAISAFDNPSAASNTIRARCANPARIELDRSIASSRGRSPSCRTSGAAIDMTHCPAPLTVNRVTTR